MALIEAPPATRTRYLHHLLEEIDRLVERVAHAPAAARTELAHDRLLASAVATLVLDGAASDELPDLDAAAARAAAAGPTALREEHGTPRPADTGTWLDALGVVEQPDDELIHALELLGAVAGLCAEDLAPTLCTDDGALALAELHRRITRGLVADERAGVARSADLAVHDASVGKIVYLPTPPERIPAELAELGGWLAGPAGAEHPVVAAGILHAELLRIHPFDAANGRLARTAARLVLRAGGADPDGLAAAEPTLASDAMGYHAELASTIRRRDLGIWLERWAESVADGLRTSLRSLGVDRPAPAARPRRFAADRRGEAFTLADYLEVADGDRDAAAAELGALLDAGEIRRVLGTHGLRFTVQR